MGEMMISGHNMCEDGIRSSDEFFLQKNNTNHSFKLGVFWTLGFEFHPVQQQVVSPSHSRARIRNPQGNLMGESVLFVG
jgi:hypothetical protein